MHLKLPKKTMEVALSLEDERIHRKKLMEEKAEIRQGILTSLLIDVADVFNVQLKTVQSGNQQDLTVLVRVIFYYVARIKTEYGFWPIATVAGRKDHAGVIKHLQTVDAYFKHKDQQFLTLWSHYLTNSKLFTHKDFPDGQNGIPR